MRETAAPVVAELMAAARSWVVVTLPLFDRVCRRPTRAPPLVDRQRRAAPFLGGVEFARTEPESDMSSAEHTITGRRLGYVPALDGIRAVAAMTVVGFHARIIGFVDGDIAV